MPGNRRSETALRQYLLGKASAEDSRVLEEQYFEDQELFDRLLEMDDSLLDGYLDDTLPPNEREAFERSFEMHPRRQQRLLLVRELAAKASKAPETAPEFPPRAVSPYQMLQSWLGIGVWRWGLAAALLALAVSGGWLIREVMRLQGDLQQAARVQAALQRDASAMRDELIRERERADQLAASDRSSAATAGGGQVTAPLAGVVALILSPGLRREGPLPVVRLSQQTLLVRLELLLAPAQFRRYRAVLQTAAGEERWSQADLAPTNSASRDAIRIDIPASALPTGQLVLALHAVAEDRGAALVDEYHFRVVDR
jgi:hypothetical protein